MTDKFSKQSQQDMPPPSLTGYKTSTWQSHRRRVSSASASSVLSLDALARTMSIPSSRPMSRCSSGGRTSISEQESVSSRALTSGSHNQLRTPWPPRIRPPRIRAPLGIYRRLPTGEEEPQARDDAQDPPSAHDEQYSQDDREDSRHEYRESAPEPEDNPATPTYNDPDEDDEVIETGLRALDDLLFGDHHFAEGSMSPSSSTTPTASDRSDSIDLESGLDDISPPSPRDRTVSTEAESPDNQREEQRGETMVRRTSSTYRYQSDRGFVEQDQNHDSSEEFEGRRIILDSQFSFSRSPRPRRNRTQDNCYACGQKLPDGLRIVRDS